MSQKVPSQLSSQVAFGLFNCFNCSSLSFHPGEFSVPSHCSKMKPHRSKHFNKRMALQTDNPPTTPSAQVVGNAFIEQYYQILHHSPELVFRFYQDSSVLSRPDSNGVMTTVKTMQGIKKKILSLDYKNYEAEIKTADAQESHQSGVTVLVTGCLTSKDNLRRKFAQTFFLAPQLKGYFVLNDVFRYVEDGEPLENQPINDSDDSLRVYSIPDPYPATIVEKGHHNVTEKAYDPSDHEIQSVNEKEAVVDSQPHSINGTNDAPRVHSIPDPEPTYFFDLPAPDPATTVEQGHHNVDEKAYDPSDREIQLVNEKEVVVDSQPHSNWPADFASIVEFMKGGPEPTKIYVPTNTAKATPKKTENQSFGSGAPAPASEASAPSSTDIPESCNSHEEVEGHSIYIRNFPFNMTDSQLGFVEFHSLSSMNNAIQGAENTAQEDIAGTSKDLEKGNGPAIMVSRSNGEKEKEEEDDEEESTEEERSGGKETSLLLKGPSTTQPPEATPFEEGTTTAEPTINNPADSVVQEVATSDPPIQTAQKVDPASPSTLKEKEEVEPTSEPTDFKPAFPVPPTTLEVSGSIKSISNSASRSSSLKDRSRDLICLISGRNRIHHSSSTPEISSMSTIPNAEEINGAFEALKTLLDKPVVEVFNNPDDRDQCRQLVIILSSHHTSLEKRIILDNFSSRLPEFEKNIPTAVRTRESALVIRDSNLLGANELDTLLEQGKALVSSLQYKFDELTQRHDTLSEKIRKLETDRDQVQGSITETAAQLENLHQKVSSDYKAWEASQQQTIKAGKDLIHAENIIAEIEFAWSTLKNRVFPFLN